MNKNHSRYKHGYSHTPIHNIWWQMIMRCTNPKVTGYLRYGGKGIKVCERWTGVNGFINFLKDVGPRPSPKHSIDRYPDRDGDYEPSNVRWATPKQQARNHSRARFVTWKGKTACLAEWQEITGIFYLVILKRLNRGWSVKKSLTAPVRCNSKPITFNGKSKTVTEWAKLLGVHPKTLGYRIEHWGLKRALRRLRKE